ncbi:hypothetical protein PR048_001504 [Dryococelus australis]|uniref:Uncharacterized protein n=1 Tax=Dryococelus australis TaxID=614101 RepID=A0ABQ9IHN9_9NEOP|nr:hypothetical protein PR048_001504 [Dryococelus australis]
MDGTGLKSILEVVYGLHVIHQRDTFWAGRSCDLVTEQTYERIDKVKTLSSSYAVTIAPSKSISPGLLFQRFIVVSRTGQLYPEEVMRYELSAYLTSLFEDNHILRKAAKPQLAHAIDASSIGISKVYYINNLNLFSLVSYVYRFRFFMHSQNVIPPRVFMVLVNKTIFQKL